MKNILITGANGQLGRCLQDLLRGQDDCQVYGTDLDTLDICDAAQMECFVQEHPVDVLINAAAYTAVDKAEEEVEKAFRINRDAVANLAQCAARHHIFMVHVSTDYVFDGLARHPYTEQDTPHPISAYGSSKLAGEEAMRESGCQGAIVRTSWLYSEYGHNFVKTMLKLGKEKDSLSVVYDQIGAPTYAGDLANAILRICEHTEQVKGVALYHFANEGSISWFEFAKSIFEIAGIDCVVKAIKTSEYPTKAQRPAFSLFNLSKIKNEYGLTIPYWKDSLKVIINKLCN
ncbi:MAG: dTDP-4-dehydrorhamnose reductase [Bacteroidales bacterium]|nr:dTDP-4-dehydrorhamnose reductase [Bacteroidales bacterium]